MLSHWPLTADPREEGASNRVDQGASDADSSALDGRCLPGFGDGLSALVVVALVAVEPAAAQSTGEAFCDTAMAQTIKNLFTLIQFGGPLVGGVIALGTTVAVPSIRRSDLKRDIKETRNQAVIWGIIVAPLGTAIVQFLLNNVVAGGASCGF